jgi:cytoskeleton protein RodZ
MAVEQLQFAQKENEVEEAVEESNVVGFSDKIGKMLINARKERQLTVTQIAKALNIRVEYLSAFEKNDFTSVPESSYAQGFLKSYASYLDLDGEAMVQELKQAGYFRNAVKHHIPQPIETNIMPSRTIILSSLAVLVLFLTVWGIYALKSENIIVITPKPEISEAVTPIKPVTTANKAETTPEPVVETEEVTTLATTEEVAIEEEITEVVTTATEKATTPATTEATATTNPSRILLVAEGEVWMQLRSPEGKVYMNKVFQDGEEYWITTPQDTLLDVGKPSAVRLYIDGQDTTPWKMDSRRVIKGLSTDVNEIVQQNKDLQTR